MSAPAYSWEAPAWTGARTTPELYEEHEALLLVCALLERVLPRLRAAAARGPVDTFLPEDLPVESCADPVRLLLAVQVWMARTSALLGHARADAEAQRSRRLAQARTFRLALRLVREELGDSPEVLRQLFAANSEVPLDVLRATVTLLGRRVLAGSVERRLRVIRDAVERHQQACRALPAAPARTRQPLRDAAERGDQLLDAVLRLCPLPSVLVPRAAPEQAEQGGFALPVDGLRRLRHFVRLVGHADEVLGGGRAVCCRLQGRSVGQVRAEIRAQRNRLVRVLERCAPAAQLAQSRRARRQALADLGQACRGVAVRTGTALPELTDAQAQALELIVNLGERSSLAARRGAAQLVHLLELLPAPAPDVLEWAQVAPSADELRTAEELMLNLAPSPLAELEAE